MLKGAAVVGVISAALILAYFAYSRPGYFTSQTYLGGMLFLELLAAAVWLYRRAFFPLVIVSFLLAGVDLPMSSVWTVSRWLILGVGALVGAAITLKERGIRFGLFHVLAFFSVLTASVSAAVSRYTTLSSLKLLSLALLFLYASTGARLAVLGRENRFFNGLLIGCEVFVAAVAGFYLLGREVMGNPNSLGAVMGVVAAPILLWGTLLKQETWAHRRRVVLYAISMYLTFASHGRAGILAALISCALLCVALRRYSLLAQGVGILAVLIATGAIVRPEAFSNTVSSISTTVVYKGKDPGQGLLGSRQAPWQDTVDVIRDHFWFGTGFGTSDTGQDATENLGKFASTSQTSTEHGSSYLEIVAWVGVIGVLPFLLLLGTILGKLYHTVAWMFRTADPSHAAVPLGMVLIAGLIHAGFEDWLFAPGYYLCVFYWSVAFIFVDQMAPLTTLEHNLPWSRTGQSVRRHLDVVAPTQ